jgi:HAD superfamily hydrolase (TIGR01549 family)
MIRVVSFDLDGTLVDAAYGNSVWLEGIPEHYARKHDLPVAEAKRVIKEEYDSVGESNLLWYDLPYWLDRFELEVPVTELLDHYADHIRLEPNAAEVIEALRYRYTLVIASNAARPFVEKELTHTGLGDRFDHIFSATSDFGMVKKQGEFYERLCDILGVLPHELVHVGDNGVFDVEVPRSLGINAYHYSSGSQADGIGIGDLRELLDHL